MQRTGRKIHIILIYLIAAVWLVNGLFCKVLNLVPRHEQIVARILGPGHAHMFTILIGLLETAMAAWIVTSLRSHANAVIQMVVVAAMNILEFVLAPDLLLWGRFNIVFAFMFIGLIYYNEFMLSKKAGVSAEYANTEKSPVRC
jgi:hypothetical protein